MRIEIEQEEDGRWIAEVPVLPGVMVYGRTREEAISKVKVLSIRVLADRGVGMWADREEMDDSTSWVQALRVREWEARHA